MNRKQFHSILKPYFMAFLSELNQKGLDVINYKVDFMSLDEYLVSVDCHNPNIDKDTYMGWAGTQSYLSRLTFYARSCSLIKFLKYMNEIGVKCYVPRPPKAVHCEFIPYIFSEEEIGRIFKAADEWRDPVILPDSYPLIMPVLLRLLYSTGIRIGEACALNNRDINFNRHVIYVRDTKNRCERLAPINESLEAVLKQYIYYRDKMPLSHITCPESPFFISLRGNRVKRVSLIYRFRLILDKAQIQITPSGNQARIHDVRHTACVHAMTKIAKAGKDIYCTLPILATFMGHLHVKDTEYYVKFTRDMYPEFIQQDLSVTAAIRDIIQNYALPVAHED